MSTPHTSNNILQTAFQPREVAFFMDDIPDWETLAGQLDASIEVVRIDASKDGLEQMALWADVHHGYDAIRLFSHGSNGTLNLGTLALQNSNIDQHAETLQRLGAALAETGDVLLYGCNVAQDATGSHFLQRVS